MIWALSWFPHVSLGTQTAYFETVFVSVDSNTITSCHECCERNGFRVYTPDRPRPKASAPALEKKLSDRMEKSLSVDRWLNVENKYSHNSGRSSDQLKEKQSITSLPLGQRGWMGKAHKTPPGCAIPQFPVFFDSRWRTLNRIRSADLLKGTHSLEAGATAVRLWNLFKLIFSFNDHENDIIRFPLSVFLQSIICP